MAPYDVIGSLTTALYYSVAFTLMALWVFGYLKDLLMGVNAWVSGAQTVLIGGVAAGAAFAIARMIA